MIRFQCLARQALFSLKTSSNTSSGSSSRSARHGSPGRDGKGDRSHTEVDGGGGGGGNDGGGRRKTGNYKRERTHASKRSHATSRCAPLLSTVCTNAHILACLCADHDLTSPLISCRATAVAKAMAAAGSDQLDGGLVTLLIRHLPGILGQQRKSSSPCPDGSCPAPKDCAMLLDLVGATVITITSTAPPLLHRCSTTASSLIHRWHTTTSPLLRRHFP